MDFRWRYGLLPLLPAFASAAEFTVSFADDLNDLSLSPGDVVTWTNGTYSADDGIVLTDDGTASNPILVRAETPGGVLFNGGMSLEIGGDHVIVEGFHWQGGPGKSNFIQFRKGYQYANHSIIRNCAIDSLAPNGTDKHKWIVLYGTNNTVENCSFLNKRSPGALILGEMEFNDFNPVGHTIRNNYFYNYEFRDPATTNSGDSETIRIGTSEFQDKSGSAVVEGNYFKACDGENEIISNKSADNTYRHNTFRNCHGSLVLRHGARAWVEGNFFLGENKPESGGVRVTDSFHTIINNYFQGLNNDGDPWNNAITLVGGSATSGGTSNDYQKVDGIVVAFNTIYDCDAPLFYNDRASHDPAGIFANNLIHTTRTNVVGGDIGGTGQGMTYAGNIVNGSPVGIADPGFTVADPAFVASGEIYKPGPTSPAIDAATGDYSATVTADLEGLTRPASNLDTGAHEISGATGAPIHTPFTDANVGVAVGACFLDADGNSLGDCSGTEFLSIPTQLQISHPDQSSTIPVSSNAAWQLTESIAWLTTDVTSGTGNGAVAVSVTENTVTSPRSGTITVATASASRTITVTQAAFVPPVDVTGVSLAPTEVTIAAGSTFQLTATITPSDATDQSVTYTSTNPALAAVDATGLVSGVSPGTTTIYVQTYDGGFSAQTTVTIVEAPSTNNLALNKPVTGAQPQSANPLNHLTDDNPGNRWSAETFPQSATVDLGDIYRLERTELVTFQGRAYQYIIEVASEADGPYVEIVDRSDNTTNSTETEPIEDVFNPVNARHVRITVSGASDYTGPWVSLNEFRIFGEAIENGGYAQWLETFAGVSDATGSSDPDQDGVPTILEYVLNGSPVSRDQNFNPPFTNLGTSLELTFSRRIESTQDTIQRFGYSQNLQTWTLLDINTDAHPGVSISGSPEAGLEDITITLPEEELTSGHLFWRLLIDSNFQ